MEIENGKKWLMNIQCQYNILKRLGKSNIRYQACNVRAAFRRMKIVDSKAGLLVLSEVCDVG